MGVQDVGNAQLMATNMVNDISLVPVGDTLDGIDSIDYFYSELVLLNGKWKAISWM